MMGARCENCEDGRDLQVHHRSYDNLGRETSVDLVILCKLCHEVVTRWNRTQGGAKKAEEFAMRIIARRNWNGVL